MNCQNCQGPLTPGAEFCGNCGAQVASMSQAAQQSMPHAQPPSSQPPQPFNQPSASQPLSQQPQFQQQFQNPATVNNYRMLGIAGLLVGVTILGIVSLYYSSQVDKALRQGDVMTAQSKSKSAKTWGIVSLVIGIPVLMLYAVAQSGV